MSKYITIVVAGLIAGALAAIAQVSFNVLPPYAYGICVACHGRDLVNWLVNAGTGWNLGVAPVSVIAPVLTVIGLVLGGYVASARNREFKFKTTKNPIKSFIYGFLVMVFALILGACPLRTILRIGYGDIIAVVGFLAIAIGVVVSAGLLKLTAQRDLKSQEGF